jgi:hypothetical protein
MEFGNLVFNKNYFAFSAAFVLLAVTLNGATTPVSITSTYITYANNVLTVDGSGFSPTGAAPAVLFNGSTLKVKGFTKTSVNASIPSIAKQGSYPVTIRNSQGQSATVSVSYDADATVVTDSTLRGSGTRAAPLGIQLPLTVIGNDANTVLSVYNNGDGGGAIHAETTTGVALQGFSLTAAGLQTFGNVGVDSVGYGAYSDAILGYADNNSTAYAGYFNGNVHVNGNLSKSGGSFKIDHPLDPANKYLSHSFVESPDMKNMYDGTVITDATGFARVTMPEYFEALNRDFRYQLTVISQFAQAIIGSKIAGNEFTIRTDKPGVEVSWQVTGIRQDAWANSHRILVEEEKPEKERNSYLHPELFNQPPEKSLEWVRHPEMMKQHVELMNKVAQHKVQ